MKSELAVDCWRRRRRRPNWPVVGNRRQRPPYKSSSFSRVVLVNYLATAFGCCGSSGGHFANGAPPNGVSHLSRASANSPSSRKSEAAEKRAREIISPIAAIVFHFEEPLLGRRFFCACSTGVAGSEALCGRYAMSV